MLGFLAPVEGLVFPPISSFIGIMVSHNTSFPISYDL